MKGKLLALSRIARVVNEANHQLLQQDCLLTMSFAGRRRGNKVKKGVQFTVMVVGVFSLSLRALWQSSATVLADRLTPTQS